MMSSSYRGVSLLVNCNFLSIDDQQTILGFYFAFEATVGWVKFEEVYHVIKADEWIVYRHNLGSTFQRGTEYQTTDTAKSVDSNFRHDEILELTKNNKTVVN